MVHDDSPARVVDRVLGLRLRQLQRSTGLPVVFAGAVGPAAGERRELRITHLRGTFSEALRDLRVETGRGLGGTALLTSAPCRVNDYASTRTITHDFDDQVVRHERMTSVVALPVRVAGAVGGILYGATRGPQSIGDVVLDRAVAFGAGLEQELEPLLTPPAPQPARPDRTRSALAELAELARTTGDAALRGRLARIVEDLGGAPVLMDRVAAEPAPEDVRLTPREAEVLRHVAVGRTNAEVAQAMGLSTETVRAYLRSAMRRLAAKNRVAAVHTARRLGLL